jgi:hypothetical protein
MVRLVLVLGVLIGGVARAEEVAVPPAKAAPPSWPRVGGHFGLALPIFSVNNDGFFAIGRDFGQLGVTPGITVKLNDRWAIDFEFIAASRWERLANGTEVTRSLVVVDPGVVYNWGRVSTGLRLAVTVGESVPFNFALVPIVVVPFKISDKLSYFLELDLPVTIAFLTAKPSVPGSVDRVTGELTMLLQTGFAF